MEARICPGSQSWKNLVHTCGHEQIEVKSNAQATALRKKFSALADAAHKKIEAAKRRLREQQAVLDNRESSQKEVIDPLIRIFTHALSCCAPTTLPSVRLQRICCESQEKTCRTESQTTGPQPIVLALLYIYIYIYIYIYAYIYICSQTIF